MSPDQQPTAHGPTLDRRTLLKSGAAAGAGAVGLSGNIPEPIAPVENSEAASIATLAVAGGTGPLGVAAGAAGVKLYEWATSSGDASSSDSDSLMAENIYFHMVDIANTASSVSGALRPYQQASDAQQTPFANAAWQKARAVVAEKYENGASAADAEQAAKQAVDEQAVVSWLNLHKMSTALFESITSDLTLQLDNGLSVLRPKNTNFTMDFGGQDASSWGAEWKNFSTTESGNTAVLEYTGVDWVGGLPGDITQMDRVEVSDPSSEIRVLAVGRRDNDQDILCSINGGSFLTEPDPIPNGNAFSNPIVAEHPTQSDSVRVWRGYAVRDAIKMIFDAHSQIQADLPTYIDNLYSALDDGVINPTDVIGPNEVAQEFADSDAQSRMTAEMLAIGAPVSEDVGFEALISHPDIPGSEARWAKVFPRYSGTPQSISPGTTIASADYSMAYAGYWDGNGEWNETILSGDSDLVVEDVTGVDGEEEVDASEKTATGTDGTVVIASGDSAPDPIASPADHSGWTVVVDGAANKSTHPVSDVTQDGDDYVLSTSLSDGEAVDSISIVPPVDYVKPHEATADPTTLDRSTIQAQVEAQRAVKDALDESENSGGFFGGGGFMSAGRGMIGGVIVAVLALFGLSTLN